MEYKGSIHFSALFSKFEQAETWPQRHFKYVPMSVRYGISGLSRKFGPTKLPKSDLRCPCFRGPAVPTVSTPLHRTSIGAQSPPKESIHLWQSQVLKIEGDYIYRGKVGVVGLAHSLLFIWPPSVLSTRLDRSVYFLLGETVIIPCFHTTVMIP